MGRAVKANRRAILALKLAPDKSRERVQVEGIDGLVVDVTKSGPQSFYLRYWMNGESRWKPLGKVAALLRDDSGGDGETATRLAQVIATARRDMAAVQVDKRDLVAERRDAEALGTVDQKFDEWLSGPVKTLAEATQKSYIGSYSRNLKERLGDRLLADLQKADVAAAIADILQKKGATQERQSHAVIRSFLRWCVSRGFIRTNPAEGIELDGEEQPRQRAYTPHEISRFWRALQERLDTPTGRALAILLLTGRRLKDVGTMRKADVLGIDSEFPVWQIPRPKNKRPDEVALTPTLARIIRAAIRDSAAEFVFPSRAGSQQAHIDLIAITHERERINSRLGIINATTHDFRTTISSALHEARFDEMTRKGILGHTADRRNVTASTYTDVYTLAAERAALQAFEDELNRLLVEPPSPDDRWGLRIKRAAPAAAPVDDEADRWSAV